MGHLRIVRNSMFNNGKSIRKIRAMNYSFTKRIRNMFKIKTIVTRGTAGLGIRR